MMSLLPISLAETVGQGEMGGFIQMVNNIAMSGLGCSKVLVGVG